LLQYELVAGQDQRESPEKARGWLLVSYRAPKEPSTARVAAWRRLHRVGALYIGPSTCLVPIELAGNDALTTVAEGLTAAGGSFDTFGIEAFSPEAERVLLARFNAARDAEYAEVIERAEALVNELRREGERGKFTFAEVEENEADLARLRRWLETVRRRDRFGAALWTRAEAAIEDADRRLRSFVERSAQAEEEDLAPEGEA
jgi:hypothetical protein